MGQATVNIVKRMVYKDKWQQILPKKKKQGKNVSVFYNWPHYYGKVSTSKTGCKMLHDVWKYGNQQDSLCRTSFSSFYTMNTAFVESFIF